jgi:preprotein translocase subunit SecF
MEQPNQNQGQSSSHSLGHQEQHHIGGAERKSWFDRYYKLMFLIPIIVLLISLAYLGYFYSKTGELFARDVSLAGGSTVTINGIEESAITLLESSLKAKYGDVVFRKLTDLRTDRVIAVIIESSAEPGPLKQEIENILGYKLTDENSSVEFTGSTLSDNFYKQLMIALAISFILMSLVIFIMFRTFVPSMAVIFAAFADIVMPLALLDFLGIKISSAGIAAFLMLIGYSVDTDILLTTRALKKKEGTLNERIYGSFKTGILMTLTALAAVLPAFFLVTGLPESFRQIFLILALGLCADIINTWLTNVGIIKWYCERKHIS